MFDFLAWPQDHADQHPLLKHVKDEHASGEGEERKEVEEVEGLKK